MPLARSCPHRSRPSLAQAACVWHVPAPVFRTLPLAVLITLASACSGSAPAPAEHPHPPIGGRSGAEPPAPVTREGLPAARFASVPAGTYGPYVGTRAGASIAVWAAMAHGSKARGWFSVPLGDNGKPLADPLRIGDAPAELGLVAVRPSGGEGVDNPVPGALQAQGFVIIATHQGDANREIEAIALGTRGELRGGPTVLATSGDDVVWIDAVPTRRSTLALWAVKHENRADVYAVELGLASERMGSPQLVVRGARAWQVAPLADGAAVAAVMGVEGSANGPVRLVYVDQSGKPSRPLEVSAERTAEIDLDMVRSGDGLVLAWSDDRGIEPAVYSAAVDGKGSLSRPPTRLTPPSGEQALVRLVRPFDATTPAWIAWENTAERSDRGRLLELATLSPDGTLGGVRGELRMTAGDTGVPELHATPGGLGALLLAPECQRGKPCDNADKLPTFVQFDDQANVVSTEPIRLAPLGGKGADLAWGLSCSKRGCTALAAQATSPAPLYSVDLSGHTGDWVSPGRRVTEGPAPRAKANEAIAALDPLSDVAAAQVGGATLAAWVSYFDPTTPWERLRKPAPDGRFDPVRALIQVQAFPDGKASLDAHTISLRARSLGGVALVPGDPAKHEALLVWTAVDNKLPQVFATLLGADGNKIAQHMLTHSKGDVSDVAAAWVDDGWVVGWVDERSGDPEVYATKINRQLTEVAPERRLTNTRGGATGLSLLAQGKQVLAVWADARDSAHEGWADIYAARLAAKDANPIGVEQRLMQTRPHSHSPVLAPFGNGAAVAWIEARPDNPLKDDSPGLRIGQLDDQAHFVSPPALVPARGGAPTSVSIDCDGDRCHGVLGADVDGNAELQAFVWRPGNTPSPTRLAAVSGPAGESVSPALVDGQLFFADQPVAGKGRVRRMLIDWP